MKLSMKFSVNALLGVLSPIAAIVAVATIAGAQTAQLPALPVSAHDTFSIASKAVGESRLINVHTPVGYGTKTNTRFPVLYMPDGGIDEDFPHVVKTVDSLIALGVIRPVIVVGIPNTQRRRDLTGPTTVHSDSAIAPKVGGSAAFRRFIRNELIPSVDKRYRSTDERSIIGESLAGLFVVESFLLEPSLFDHYIAFDPSLWWNKGALVDSAAALAGRFKGQAPTLFLSVSSDGIGDQITRLTSILRADKKNGPVWEFRPRPDLTHPTIFAGMGPAGLAWSLR
jgi:predicted alpha/beta superfamily hydrolase